MAIPNAGQIATNWRNGMASSGEKLKAGVNAVTESPTAKAARNIDRMVAGVQRAAQSGKTQRALERVSLEDWKKSMLEKGAARVASGAAAAVSKVQDFFQEFIPWLEAGQRKLESMPRGDIEQNIARAVEMMRHNSQFRRTR